MTAKKAFTAPFWWLITIIIFHVLMQVLTWFTLHALMEKGQLDESYYRGMLKSRLVSEGAFTFLLAGEAILWWNIRKKITRKPIAWVYIAFLLAAFMCLPLLITLYSLLTPIINPEGYKPLISTGIYTTIFWTALIIAHFCLAIILMDYNQSKRIETYKAKEEKEGPDILNDYEGQ